MKRQKGPGREFEYYYCPNPLDLELMSRISKAGL